MRTAPKSKMLPVSNLVSSHLQHVELAILERLFDQIPEIAFFVKDCDGKYVTVNHSLILRHGLEDKRQAIGKRPIDICPGDFGRLPTEQDNTVLATGEAIIDHLEMQWLEPNQPVWCLTSKFPQFGSSGEIIGLIGISRDVQINIDLSDVPADFARVIESFEKQLPAEATPSWLAKRAKVSPNRFARIIKRVYGLTPSQFITKTRVAAASRMLIEGDRSVAEIAHSCGFYDHSAFSRAFRMSTGASPSEFRKRWSTQASSRSDVE